MKKNKIAFTMIELIVVTLIMVLLTSSSVFYFFDFTDNRELIIHPLPSLSLIKPMYVLLYMFPRTYISCTHISFT